MLVGDGIDVGMARGFDRETNKVGFMSFQVDREGTEEFLRLVQGFFDGEGSLNPIDYRVDFFEPGES